MNSSYKKVKKPNHHRNLPQTFFKQQRNDYILSGVWKQSRPVICNHNSVPRVSSKKKKMTKKPQTKPLKLGCCLDFEKLTVYFDSGSNSTAHDQLGTVVPYRITGIFFFKPTRHHRLSMASYYLGQEP